MQKSRFGYRLRRSTSGVYMIITAMKLINNKV